MSVELIEPLVDEEVAGPRGPAPRGILDYDLTPFERAGATAPLGFWDPLNLSDVDVGRYLFYREVEIKHGRVAMLASIGFPVAEQFHPLFGGGIDVPSYIAFQQTPLQTFWVAVLLGLSLLELRSIGTFASPLKLQGLTSLLLTNEGREFEVESKPFEIKPARIPGDLGWDPRGSLLYTPSSVARGEVTQTALSSSTRGGTSLSTTASSPVHPRSTTPRQCHTMEVARV